MENSSSNLSSLPEEDSQNGGTAAQSASKSPSAFSSKPDRPPIQTSSQKYAPLDWSNYFDQEDDVHIPDSENVFHFYKAGNEGPVVLCLHGGGYSGLSFALSAKLIKEKARVVALDLRGHGKSYTENDLDLSIETLCNDVVAVVKTMYGDSPPAIVMVGHSMGGALAVHIAAKKVLPSLAALVVVDVVEGTAMASLMHMQQILSNRMYEGLSEKFLASPVPKLFLLAGTDRLDKTLTIGQMQGKFQMVVVRHTGHAIQEDVPDEFANLILNFISHNRISPHGVVIPGLRRPSQ
ncbi:hypothetical protein SASPL_103511 [Salvia splendens]|uniref:Protein phosphatase methylesterase 1 n=1 Tax=Salvia splendens TaxID=180675 RepID=A0A8X9A9S1_SALSN|nr:hypothetical protein SASPL_103511 [Salvia splendens]